MSYFYKPADAVCADFIPFYQDGTYYLFYLKDYRNHQKHGEGTPWFLVTTQDFVHFEEHGEVLPRGTKEEQDLYVFTGCVLQAEGQYHIFYTGHNPHLRAQNKPEQAVMHAVSDDLLHWRKCPEDTFYAPQEGYEPHDWRDPFIFYDEAVQEYRMLLAARTKEGIPRRRGLTAMCASPDLRTWRVIDPLWAPQRFFTHECPDLFQMGEWYYLLYSEFTEDKVTRYRMARSLQGPWLAPADDRLDGTAYYAAKSAGSGVQRFLFGWIPTREGDQDTGAWQWGGCLCAHEICQRPDGTLYIRMPEPLLAQATQCSVTHGEQALWAAEGWAEVLLGEMPSACMLELTFSGEAQAVGVHLYTDAQMDGGHFVRLALAHGRMTWDQWPRSGEVAFTPGLERPLAPSDQHTLRVVVDGTAICAYLDGEVAMCARAYVHHQSRWGVFVQDGETNVAWTVFAL